MGRSDICCTTFGTSFEAKRWLTIDPCGLLCITLSFSVHFYAISVIAYLLISKSLLSQIVYFAVYLPCALLAVVSLYTAWTTNPGAVPMGARPLTKMKKAGSSNKGRERSMRRCAKCNDNYKPPRAHHDSVTGRCVVKMDHFCPWVCNAVGALNHKFFVLFIFYTLLSCLLSVVLIMIRMVHCGYEVADVSSDEETGSSHEAEWAGEERVKSVDPDRALSEFAYPECNGLYDHYLLAILFVCSIAFLIFTCTMLFEQIEAIESNTGKIARMKMKIGQGGTELERVTTKFNEMFGGESATPTWHWFLPLQVTFPDGMRKVVLGYEWDPTFGDEPYQENDMVAAVMKQKSSLRSSSSSLDDGSDLEVGLRPPVVPSAEDPPPLTPPESSPDSSTHGKTTFAKKRAGAKKADAAFSSGVVDKTKEIA